MSMKIHKTRGVGMSTGESVLLARESGNVEADPVENATMKRFRVVFSDDKDLRSWEYSSGWFCAPTVNAAVTKALLWGISGRDTDELDDPAEDGWRGGMVVNMTSGCGGTRLQHGKEYQWAAWDDSSVDEFDDPVAEGTIRLEGKARFSGIDGGNVET